MHILVDKSSSERLRQQYVYMSDCLEFAGCCEEVSLNQVNSYYQSFGIRKHTLHIEFHCTFTGYSFNIWNKLFSI